MTNDDLSDHREPKFILKMKFFFSTKSSNVKRMCTKDLHTEYSIHYTFETKNTNIQRWSSIFHSLSSSGFDVVVVIVDGFTLIPCMHVDDWITCATLDFRAAQLMLT